MASAGARSGAEGPARAGRAIRESPLRGFGVLVLQGAEHLDLTLEVGLLAVDEEGVDEEGYPRYGERNEEEWEKALPLGLFRAERREQEQQGC